MATVGWQKMSAQVSKASFSTVMTAGTATQCLVVL